MADYNVVSEYKETMKKIENTDDADAKLFNDRFQVLLNNEKFLKEKIKNSGEEQDKLNQNLGGLKFSVVDGILTVTYDDGL